MKDKEEKKRTTKGFTIIEMIISIGILAIMATALASTFSSGFSTYGSSRELQRNLETAQFVMNILEKYLRTSTVKDTLNGLRTTITFYDYSSGRCFQYRINANALQVRWYADTFANCGSGGFGTIPYSTVTTGYVTGGFQVVNSDAASTPKKMGRVTVSLSVKKDNASSKEAHIQVTASLRDYTYVGF